MGLAMSNLEIVKPNDLRSKFDANNLPGNVKYTVSTFGSIPYTEKDYIQVVTAPKDNGYGCRGLVRPSNLTESDKFVWLVKRGQCTYSKKAFIAQQSGAFAVLVYHNQQNVDVSNIIPCADSVCKMIR